jgi:alpha-mannosidase
LPWHRKGLIDISETEAAVACGDSPFMTLRKFKSPNGPAVTVKEVSKNVFVLDSEHLKVTVAAGCITSLYDKMADREVIPEGQKANQYVLFDDKPLYWQAWDVEVYHLDSRKELSSGETEISETLDHRVSVVTRTRISEESSIETTISLSAAVKGEPSMVEVSSRVDWHETMKFLKVEFPVDVRNTEASYETQFGIMRRPTHYNTSWDMAKFEVCCHKFADLSEHGYGVSVLNDSKYGFATCGNLMRLSLLRSPKAPDAHADMGVHHIRWAVLPHVGTLGPVTVRKAYEFNSPMKLLARTAIAGDSAKLLGIDTTTPLRLTGAPSLVLDTVKRGDDDAEISAAGDQDLVIPARVFQGRTVVLRIYESLGGRACGTVETTWNVKRVYKTNVLEDELEPVEFTGNEAAGGSFAVVLRPFEVATYKMVLA